MNRSFRQKGAPLTRQAGRRSGNGRWVILVAWAMLAAASCSRPGDPTSKRILTDEEPQAKPAGFDWSKPETTFAMNADEATARIGSFDWSAKVDWIVTRGSATPIRMAESHRVRQMKAGPFLAESDLDPDGMRRADSGKRVVYANKMTYARGRYAPFDAYRERPTDRGRDARRYRDESFGVAGDLAGLFGSTLVLTPAGDATLLSRNAKRFSLSLSPAASGGQAARAPARRTGVSTDEDTQRRLAFMNGRVPVEAHGEILADAETGVLLSASVRGAFRVQGNPDVRIDVALTSQMTAIGDGVAAVVPPINYLPDQRKPRGVARALEAAGLKKRGGAEAAREEPEDDGE